MPRNRKKKKWIDKNKAITYVVVSRSQKDPRIVDDESSKYVLAPVVAYNKPVSPQLPPSPSPYPSYTDGTDDDFDDDDDVNDFDSPVPVGLNFPDDDYNYDQHLKEIGTAPGAVFITASGKVIQNPQHLPSEVLAPIQEEEVGLLEKGLFPTGSKFDDEMDEDILNALEHFDSQQYEELPDDFVQVLKEDNHTADDDNIEFGSYGKYDELEDDTHEKKDNDDDGDDIEETDIEDTKSVVSTTSTSTKTTSTSTRRNNPMLEEMFAVALKAFDEDRALNDEEEDDISGDDIDDIDDEASSISKGKPAVLPGALTTDDFKGVFDEFLHENSLKLSIPDKDDDELPSTKGEHKKNTETPSNINIKDKVLEIFETEEEESEEEIDLIFVKEKRSEWDAESIISTYSNTENHPALIAEPAPDKKIKLNKKGFPNVFPIKEESTEEEEESSGPNKGAARPKKETREEKKQRKKAIKAERKENRERKKELRLKYREEEVRQRNIGTGQITRRTIINY